MPKFSSDGVDLTFESDEMPEVSASSVLPIPIYRKQQIGEVRVSDNGGNITVEAMKQITDFIINENREKKNKGNNYVGQGPITDAFEFVYGEHRVQVRLGMECQDD